jgi:hypothetical protein
MLSSEEVLMARLKNQGPPAIFDSIITLVLFAFGVACLGYGTWGLVNGVARGVVVIVFGVVAVGVALVRQIMLSSDRFVRDPRRWSLGELRAEADSRAVEELQGAAHVDAARPLLVVGQGDDGKVNIHMIVIREQQQSEEPILMVPEYRRGRPFALQHFPDFAALRSYLKAHGLRVVPQSGLSDELGRSLFGNDWRED